MHFPFIILNRIFVQMITEKQKTTRHDWRGKKKEPEQNEDPLCLVRQDEYMPDFVATCNDIYSFNTADADAEDNVGANVDMQSMVSSWNNLQ